MVQKTKKNAGSNILPGLVKNDQWFRTFYELGIVGMAVISPDRQWIEVNDRLCEIFGYSRDELTGTAIDRITHPDDRESGEALYGRILAGETDGLSMEKRYIRKDGSVIYAQVSARCIRNDDTGIDFFIAIVNDTTERTQAEIALRENEQRFRSLVESLPEAVVIVDDSLNIIFWNESAQTMFGYTAEEAVGRPFWMLSPDHMKDGRGPTIDETVAHIEAGSVDTIRRGSGQRKDGSEFPSQMTASTWTEDGRIRIGTIIRDLSERASMEEQIRKLQKMEAIGILAGGIAHDFNNILGIIMTNTEMAMEDVPTGSDTHQSVSQILKGSRRAQDLIKQILLFSRRTEKELAPLKLTPQLKESIKFLRASLPSSINIRQNILAERDTVVCEPNHLHQILVNLCTNAARAMEDSGGILTITLENRTVAPGDTAGLPAGEYAELTVSDTGCGIAADNLHKIFDPYFTTKRVGEGSGLGLSVALGIAKSIKGTITADNNPGAGATFRVLLPVAASQKPPEGAGVGEPSGGSERILFVDDEELFASAARRMLSRLGYTVTVAADPLKALDIFTGSPDAFDLVITDKTMPTMSGFELAKQIKQVRSDIPVILCTGMSEVCDIGKISDIGIAEFLHKPLVRKELDETVRRAIEKKHGA